MSNIGDPVVPAASALSCATPKESNANGPLEQLAWLGARSGLQDEFLTHPDKVVLRFMDDFVAPVQQWCQAHADKVRSCYVAADGRVPAVLVIGTTPGYDYSLKHPLAALEADLHRRGWRCSVLQLPSDQPALWPMFIREPEAIQVFPLDPPTSHAQR
jgi:hypothetical protein